MPLRTHIATQENRAVKIEGYPRRVGVAMKIYSFDKPSNTIVGASVVVIAATFKYSVTG